MPRASAHSGESRTGTRTRPPLQAGRTLRSKGAGSQSVQPTLDAALTGRRPLRSLGEMTVAARMRVRSVSSNSSEGQRAVFHIGSGNEGDSDSSSVENQHEADVRACNAQTETTPWPSATAATQTEGDFLTREEALALFIHKEEQPELATRTELRAFSLMTYTEENVHRARELCMSRSKTLDSRINEQIMALERKIMAEVRDTSERLRSLQGADVLGPIVGRALAGGFTEPDVLKEAVSRAFGADLMTVSRKTELRKLRDISFEAIKSKAPEAYLKTIDRLLNTTVDIDADMDTSVEFNLSDKVRAPAAGPSSAPQGPEIGGTDIATTAKLSRLSNADLERLKLYISKAQLELNVDEPSEPVYSRQSKRRFNARLLKNADKDAAPLSSTRAGSAAKPEQTDPNTRVSTPVTGTKHVQAHVDENVRSSKRARDGSPHGSGADKRRRDDPQDERGRSRSVHRQVSGRRSSYYGGQSSRPHSSYRGDRSGERRPYEDRPRFSGGRRGGGRSGRRIGGYEPRAGPRYGGRGDRQERDAHRGDYYRRY